MFVNAPLALGLSLLKNTTNPFSPNSYFEWNHGWDVSISDFQNELIIFQIGRLIAVAGQVGSLSLLYADANLNEIIWYNWRILLQRPVRGFHTSTACLFWIEIENHSCPCEGHLRYLDVIISQPFKTWCLCFRFLHVCWKSADIATLRITVKEKAERVRWDYKVVVNIELWKLIVSKFLT